MVEDSEAKGREEPWLHMVQVCLPLKYVILSKDPSFEKL
jgi:hypothetical protein